MGKRILAVNPDPQERFVMSDTIEIPIIQPENWTDLGPGAVTVTIIFGPATFRAGISVEHAAELPVVTGFKQRQAIMDVTVNSIKTNAHLAQPGAGECIIGAATLALSSEAGEVIKETKTLGGAKLTYTITPLPGGREDRDYNWRLVAEPGNK
jgi:hypothetical protein